MTVPNTGLGWDSLFHHGYPSWNYTTAKAPEQWIKWMVGRRSFPVGFRPIFSYYFNLRGVNSIGMHWYYIFDMMVNNLKSSDCFRTYRWHDMIVKHHWLGPVHDLRVVWSLMRSCCHAKSMNLLILETLLVSKEIEVWVPTWRSPWRVQDQESCCNCQAKEEAGPFTPFKVPLKFTAISKNSVWSSGKRSKKRRAAKTVRVKVQCAGSKIPLDVSSNAKAGVEVRDEPSNASQVRVLTFSNWSVAIGLRSTP